MRINNEILKTKYNPAAFIKNKMNTQIISPEYNKNYTVFSLIMMYFIYSFIGWLYEAGLYLCRGEGFVNRGMLHGPWLPIYGSGGILILILLKRWRGSPKTLFILTLSVCAVVEYITAWYLETFLGAKWWDYSDYYFNLHGRICLEGLLLFGILGLLSVYVISPRLDTLLRKVPKYILYGIMSLLAVIFLCDLIHSAQYPNIGAGIARII